MPQKTGKGKYFGQDTRRPVLGKDLSVTNSFETQTRYRASTLFPRSTSIFQTKLSNHA
jgi:hypothetical protein